MEGTTDAARSATCIYGLYLRVEQQLAGIWTLRAEAARAEGYDVSTAGGNHYNHNK
jgi:hypothetical protein